MGMLSGRLYIIKANLDHGLNDDFIHWYFDHEKFVDGRCPVYHMMENNKLQDPFFQQVFKPLVAKTSRELGMSLVIKPDEERKTDKATRIEANLEPLSREGRLVFNIDEKDNPHMQRLVDQFSLFTLQLKYPADGPDCVEGGYRAIREKNVAIEPTVAIRTRKNIDRL